MKFGLVYTIFALHLKALVSLCVARMLLGRGDLYIFYAASTNRKGEKS